MNRTTPNFAPAFPSPLGRGQGEGPLRSAASLPAPRRPLASSPRRGIGLIEAIVTLVLVTGLLTGLVAVSNSLRAGSAEEQTRTIVRQLHMALAKYTESNHTAPPGPTGVALAALRRDEGSRPLLKGLTFTIDETGQPTVADGYGRAIAYITAEDHPSHTADFVSAGADGRFGAFATTRPADRRAAVDDVLGSDMEVPGP